MVDDSWTECSRRKSPPHNRPHVDQPPLDLQTGDTAKVGPNVRRLYRRAHSTGDGQKLGIGNRLVDDTERGYGTSVSGYPLGNVIAERSR
mgnify:CR=1 FL=1